MALLCIGSIGVLVENSAEFLRDGCRILPDPRQGLIVSIQTAFKVKEVARTG